MYKGNFSLLHTRIFTTVAYPCTYDEVKKIKIVNGDPLQLTVISNILENVSFNPDNNDYIVFPFPLIKGRNRVKIIDMEKYPKLFDDLSLTFTDLEKDENEYSALGKYDVEILNKIDDLDLSYEIKENYNQGFGFIRCHPKFYKYKTKDIKNNKVEFLPFAYLHEINPDTKLFMPTKIISLNKKIIKSTNAGGTIIAGDYADELDTSANDKFISWFLKKKELIAPPQTIASKNSKSFELYITNFPRVMKNPLLTQTGAHINEKEIKEKHDLFLSKSKFPKNLDFKKINYIHQINIDTSYKFNHNLFC